MPQAWPVWLAADDGVLIVGCVGRPDDGSAPLDHDGQPLEVGRPIAVARVAMLSAQEAWLEGIRVDPRVRGMDVATDLQVAELHWVASFGAAIVRYATSQHNEGSHRLGARHGFALLTALRTYWWREPGAPDDQDHDDESGFGEEARLAAGRRRVAALERLAAAGLVVRDAERWWARASSDATFLAGARLYEHRAWALQELTLAGFGGHFAAGEVLGLERADGAWALAIFEREPLPAEDVSLHLGVLVGDGAAALELASAIRQAAGDSIRFRLADPDPPLLRDQAAAFMSAGFQAREWTLHILSRSGDLPPPVIESQRITLEDPAVAHAR